MMRFLHWLFLLLRNFFHRPEISLLIPFGASKGSDRRVILKWLIRYWRYMPRTEIIIGRDEGFPFSKTSAVNDAARRARGKIFVILDADAYFDYELILESARRIREAERRGRHLWFIPYRHLYRLTSEATKKVLSSDPKYPYRFSSPPPYIDIQHTHSPHYGHHYAAMVMVMSKEAFWEVGGMEERMAGWGNEDACFMFALDTLYGPHRTLDREVLHLYHRRIGLSWNTTMWANQEVPMPNRHLAMRYSAARGDKKRMRTLVDEFKSDSI